MDTTKTTHTNQEGAMAKFDPYWEKQATKHERMAISLEAKYFATNNRGYWKQARSNRKTAEAIRNCPKHWTA